MYKDTVETSSELSELEIMIREQMQIDKQFKENHPEWNSGRSAVKEDSITISKSYHDELIDANAKAVLQVERLETENVFLKNQLARCEKIIALQSAIAENNNKINELNKQIIGGFNGN